MIELGLSLDVILESFFLLLLPILAVAILFSENMAAIAIMSCVFSMVMAVIYLLLAAPDVAMTESAIGAAISTAILIKSMQLTQSRILSDKFFCLANIISFFALLFFGAMMIYGFADLPDYGQGSAPVNSYISKDYIKNTPSEIGIASSVAAILASYRGFDTLGETLVIMVAGLVVYFVMNIERPVQVDLLDEKAEAVYENKIWMTDYIRTMLLPVSLILAFYIQVHGEISPGGGFQAGSVLSSIFIFYFVVADIKSINFHKMIKTLLKLSFVGFLIYLLMAIYTAVIGGYFLEYYAITGTLLGHKIGIFIIEIGVGITVFSVMLMIFLLFEYKLQSKPITRST